MSAEDEGVTLPEVNRNVIELRRQLEGITATFVPMNVWNENVKLQETVRLETGRRIGALENEIAERRKAFTTTFLYPVLVLIIGTGIGVLVTISLRG